MTSREYTWRFTKSVFRRLVRNARRNEMLEQLHIAGRAAVYAGLVAYARPRTKRNGQSWDADGWAANAFKEIFGTWPRDPDRRAAPQPLPDALIEAIEQWAAGRKRKARPLIIPQSQQQARGMT